VSLGAVISAGIVSALLLPRARDAAVSGELAGAGLVFGFWVAALAAICGAGALGWVGVAVMVAAAGALMVESMARRIGRGAKR
jgi:hypothetical protein